MYIVYYYFQKIFLLKIFYSSVLKKKIRISSPKINIKIYFCKPKKEKLIYIDNDWLDKVFLQSI